MSENNAQQVQPPGHDIPEHVREFSVEHEGRTVNCRAIDNGCYWELHVLQEDGTWHEMNINEDWPEPIVEGYDAAWIEGNALNRSKS